LSFAPLLIPLFDPNSTLVFSFPFFFVEKFANPSFDQVSGGVKKKEKKKKKFD
jgi:hypothetical protein